MPEVSRRLLPLWIIRGTMGPEITRTPQKENEGEKKGGDTFIPFSSHSKGGKTRGTRAIWKKKGGWETENGLRTPFLSVRFHYVAKRGEGGPWTFLLFTSREGGGGNRSSGHSGQASFPSTRVDEGPVHLPRGTLYL